MTEAHTADLYYDPFDFDIDDNPYPIWKRLRDEAPLYHNEKFNFYALSRYEDVARELHNWDTYRSGKGTTIDIIMSGIEVPPGVILFEDPPLHDLHRRVAVKGFHAAADGGHRAADASVLRARARCAGGVARFDLIADFGALVPMRTIGYLLGIPEAGPAADPGQHRRVDRSERRHFQSVSAARPSRMHISCSPSTSNGVPSTRPTT